MTYAPPELKSSPTLVDAPPVSQAAADRHPTPAVRDHADHGDHAEHGDHADHAGARARRSLPAVGALTALLCGLVALELLAAGLDGQRLPLAVAALLSALLLAGTGTWVARYGVHGPAAHLLTVGALLLVAANGVGAMVALADPRRSLLVVIVIVAAGGLVTSGRWLAASAVGMLVCWTAGAVAVGADAAWLPYGIALLAAAATAWVLHVLGARSLAEVRAVRSLADAAAVRDELTGCVNPRGVAMFGAQILEAARRRGDAVHCLFVTVDGFARVTAVFGADAGDDLLVAVADALRSATRATDVVGRWDCDVFVVVGPGRGVPVPQIERRIAAGLKALTAPVGPPPRVLAAGALLAPWDAGTIESLLDRADGQFAARRSMRRRAADAPPAGSTTLR